MVRSVDISVNWRKVIWAVLLTPAAGCVGYVLLIVFWLVTNERLPGGVTESSAQFYALSFFLAAIMGGMFAAPVTLVVLPVVRCLRPGRDKISFLALALSGLIFGFLSPAVMLIVMASAPSFVTTDRLLGLGGMGAGSGLIMAIVWFFITRPATGEVSARMDWSSAMSKLTNTAEVIAYIAAHGIGIGFSILGGSAYVILTARAHGYQSMVGVSLAYSVVLMLIVMLLFFLFRAFLSTATRTSRE